MKSKKFNIFSSCIYGRLNNKIFLLLLMAVTLFVNGFLFLRVFAYESLSETYVISGGVDNTEGENILFDDRDINALSLSDDERIGNNSSSWTKGDNYNENDYLEFVFSPNVSTEAIVESVIVSNEFRRYGALEGVKIEVWDGEKFIDFNLTKGTIGDDHTDIIDISSVINNVDKLNNLKIRFLAYRGIGADTKTSHDFIGINVKYHLPDEIPIEPAFHTDINEDVLEDTIWTKDKSPYVIKSSITVSDGATLVIEKGVIVKFYNQSDLIIFGKLNILGDPLDRVYFTSLNDDSLGGDSEGDGDYSPEIGDFGGISFYEPDDISNINNLSINYASNPFSILSSKINLTNVNIAPNTGSIFIENSFINIDNILIEDGYFHINNSDVKIANSNINSKSSGSIIYGSSKIDLINTSVLNSSIYDPIFSIYNKSFAKISDSTFSYTGYGISVYDKSILEISKSKISGGEYGLFIFNESNLIMNNSIISDQSVVGVQSYYNEDFYGENNIKILKSEIINNNYGFILDDSFFDIKNNNISNNKFGAATYSGNLVNLSSNFWGDQTGPYNFISNREGKGNEVNDWISFVPFLKTDPTKNIKNPVIIIPGITGSYLIKDYDNKEEIWPNASDLAFSLSDEFLNDLSLNKNGENNTLYPITTGDIIRGISLPAINDIHVFDLFIGKLIEDGYIEGKDLFVFSYDWRFSTESTALLLKNKIDEILTNSEYTKVDIVAHSMGGLVAKKYIKENGVESIDKLIFLGTPQLGSPKAFKALMYGDDMGYGFKLTREKRIKILNPNRVKIITQNMPSVYELLPSSKYIETNGKYVIDATREIVGLSSFDLDYNQTKNLMIKEGRNSYMFPFAEDLHSDIDDLDLSNIKSYNFVGCANPTIGSITVAKERSWKNLYLGLSDDYRLGYTDGDETVPLVSARETVGSQKFYAKGVSHGSLPASSNIIVGILSLLKGESITFDNILQDNDDFCGIEGNIISTHSPVLLHIYDEYGNHTGPDIDDNIEYGIEGVEYDVIEDINYVFLPKGKNYRIVTEATDIGGFTLKIEEQKDEDITNTHKWTLVPQPSLYTKGELMIGPDYNTDTYELKIDDNGDGDFENGFKEGFDGTLIAEDKTKKERKIIGSIIKSDVKDIENLKEFDILKLNKNILVSDNINNNDNQKINKTKNQDIVSNENENNVNKDNALLASAGQSEQFNSKIFLIIFSVLTILWLAIRLIFKLK